SVPADSTVAVQFWVDPPEDVVDYRSDPSVQETLKDAVKNLVQLAGERAPGIEDQLRDALTNWVQGGSDLQLTILGGYEAAVGGVDSHHRAGSGQLEDFGRSVMVSAGPDRYGIRVRPPGDRSGKGLVTRPNERFKIELPLYVNALSDDVSALAKEVR